MTNKLNHTIKISFIFCILFLGLSNSLHAQEFSLENKPSVVLKKHEAEIFQYWELENKPALWKTNFIQPQCLKAYQDSLMYILGVDSFKHIVQQLAFQSVSFKSIETKNGDSINAQLIHSTTVGKIRAINFLEAQLLNYQLSRYPLLSHPTEFHGFILLHDSLQLVKIYFAASNQPWPPKPTVILEAIKNDLKKGWILKYHLHNHYEPKKNNYLGILAPSITDVHYYKFLAEDFNLQQSIITNGFHTVEIKSNEFRKLKSNRDN